MRFGVLRPLLLALILAAPAEAASVNDFQHWLSAAPGRRAEEAKFERFIARAQVAHIVPAYELLLSASSWRGCGEHYPYTMPPENTWPNVVGTLKFIRAKVVPTIGPVHAVSGYRSPALGKCAGGAPQSAHGLYYALDLVPVKTMDRAVLIRKMCALHAKFGGAYHVGLGFYDHLRFHVDTKSTRLWGPDYHAATSPCLVGIQSSQHKTPLSSRPQ